LLQLESGYKAALHEFLTSWLIGLNSPERRENSRAEIESGGLR